MFSKRRKLESDSEDFCDSDEDEKMGGNNTSDEEFEKQLRTTP